MIFSLFWEGEFIRGGVYFKLRDFRGRLFEGGVFSRRGVYSRKYGICKTTDKNPIQQCRKN